MHGMLCNSMKSVNLRKNIKKSIIMKSFFRFANIASALLTFATFTSCSNVDSPSPDEGGGKEHILNKIAAGEKVTVSYVMTDCQLFDNDERSGNKWEEINLEEYSGWSTALPSRINIIDSRVGLPYKMYSHIYGPSTLGMVWDVYCKVTNVHPQLCIETEIKVDEQNNTFSFGNMTCVIEAKTKNGFLVTYDSPYYYHGNNGNMLKGTSRERATYNQEPFDESALENTWFYPSEQDLIVDLLTRFRAQFGDEINLNDYLYPNIILDDPIVNFDELEKTLLTPGSL